MKQKMRYVSLFVQQNQKMQHIGRVRLSVKNLIFQHYQAKCGLTLFWLFLLYFALLFADVVNYM